MSIEGLFCDVDEFCRVFYRIGTVGSSAKASASGGGPVG
jgi:hypothetical protein